MLLRSVHLPSKLGWLKWISCAGVPRETFKNEQRVAVTPASCAALLTAGFQGVVVESGAGAAAGFVVSCPVTLSLSSA